MSNLNNKNENLEFELDDNSILSNLFGINDSNLQIIGINQLHSKYPIYLMVD